MTEITIRMTLGNDDFQTPEDVCQVLRVLIESIDRQGFKDFVIRDVNGNRVGKMIVE